MKFTLNWLKDYIDFKDGVRVEDISTTLTAIGLEVDGVEDRSKAFAPFKVAHVEEAVQHPDADKLRVCKVNTGDEIIQVVCGAPNARSGMKGVFAPSGAYVPGIDVWLKPTKLRGVESHGMLVSEREMELSDDHDGIIDLPEGTKVGTPITDIYPELAEVVFEISLTPNRPDCAGIYGIARDLAAAGLGTFKPVSQKPIKGEYDSPVKLTINEPEACPVFLGRYVKGVKNGPSPAWVQNRLRAVGLRPISALVDITNYMSVALCRPLHVFDADKLKGDITIELSKGGEKLEGLNDKNYTLLEGQTTVNDDSGVLGLGGILGGVPSSCTEETTNVYIECAYFDPVRTAITGRRLQIISDARYRFERGIDPQFMAQGMEVATQMVMDLCGGEPSEVVQAGDVPEGTKEVTLRYERVRTLGGINVAPEQQESILNALGFDTVSKDAATITVKTPSWRPDIDGEADLVEEVVRIYGYDKLEAVELPRQEYLTPVAETSDVTISRKLRTALAARGLKEAVTWSFMDENFAKDFTNDNRLNDGLKLMNPISEDMNYMRPSILPNLIEAAAKNADRGFSNTALFEVGPIFQDVKADAQPIIASGVRYGLKGEKHWQTGAPAAVDCFDAKADALDALNAVNAPTSLIVKTENLPQYFHPGRSGALCMGKKVLAYFGEIHPMILQKLDIDEAVVGFEVFPQELPPRKSKGASKKLLQVSALMPLKRDFAFIVDETTQAEDLIKTIAAADKKLITHVELFDVYQGKGVEDGKKSLAFSVTLQPTDKTLTDEEIEAVSKQIIDLAAKKANAILRG